MSMASADIGEIRSNRQAIAVMCAGVSCLSVSDALAKWLIEHYDPMQIIFMRNLVALPIVGAFILARSGRSAFATSHLRVHALRGLLSVGAAYAFFSALGVLPHAEATSLVFAAPLFITALSVPLLGEHVGWRRWSAVIVGFAGVLVIVQPGAATFQAASTLPLVAALLYALIMLSTRWIDRRESTWTMMFYMALFPTLFAGLAVLPSWRALQVADLPFIAAIAVFGTVGVTLISHAFRLGHAAVVAPFDYTALIWASLLGWLVWGEIPGSWTYAGAVVIIASGIYIVMRESRTAQE
jgi:drug/metabolite transporter (DMT)-like permease